MYCSYYQVKVIDCSFFVAIMRSFEHLSFDRTVDKSASIFELFVPEGNEATFLELMKYFESQNIITGLQKLPHRLLDPNETI